MLERAGAEAVEMPERTPGTFPPLVPGQEVLVQGRVLKAICQLCEAGNR